MKLLPLTNDFICLNSLCRRRYPDRFLNSFPEFRDRNHITSLKVLNPDIPKDMNTEKAIILDIK